MARKKYYSVEDVYDVFATLLPNIEEFNNEEWFIEIKRHIDDIFLIKYGERYILKKVDEGNYTKLLEYIYKCMSIALYENAYTFKGLYESTQLEFNPLWNVDGTEEETITRTLTSDGTEERDLLNNKLVTNVQSSTEDVINSVSEERGHTGTDTASTTHTGTDTTTNSHTGTDTASTTHTGTDTTTNSHTGTDNINKSVSETKEQNVSNTTMDSAAFYDTQKTSENNSMTDDTTNTHNTKDDGKTTYDTTNDTTNTYNTKDDGKTTYDTTNDTTNTYNTKDSINIDNSSSSESIMNSNITDTSTDKGTINNTNSLLEKITNVRVRSGNIGVTKSTDLIDSFRDTVNFNYLDTVAHILINYFTFQIY